MRKKLHVSLKSHDDVIDYDVIGDISKDEIYFEELDDENTAVIYNMKDNILKRDNPNLYMEYNFGEPDRSNILVKDIGQNLEIDLKVKKIKQSKNTISIDYELNDIKYKYSIKIKEN